MQRRVEKGGVGEREKNTGGTFYFSVESIKDAPGAEHDESTHQMIKILFKQALSCPIFCNDMIGDISEGAAVFLDLPRRKENQKIEVLHVHKGKCYELAERRLEGKCEWQPLGAHLYFLCANIEIDAKQLDKLKKLHGTRTA